MNKRSLSAIALAFAALVAPGRSDAAPTFPFSDLRHGISPAARGFTDVVDVRRVPGVRDFGPIVRNRRVAIGVFMRLRHEDELAALTLAQSNPRSPYFHRYLTPAQFTNYFAPEAAIYKQTIATLERRGFRISQTLANHTAIMAVAPAGVVERYFQTSLHQVFQSGVRDGDRYVNMSPAIVPNELREAIVSVSGLHSIRTARFPIHFAARQRSLASSSRSRRRSLPVRRSSASSATPNPASTSTPSAPQPGPDPTEAPDDPAVDYADYEAYGPPTFASSYDFPVQHGYGGRDQIVASVIDSDYLDSDAALEFKTFNIQRTGGLGQRFCADPDGGPSCDNTIGQPDPEGEATLDAETMLSLAPAAHFYTFIAPAFDDVQIEFAYEDLVSQDAVGVESSSFGSCETLDPDFEYTSNYIAMEGAVLGISFGASTGDTGAGGCGLYAGNGAPETEDNLYAPSADDYFTAVGGSDYFPLVSCTGTGNDCYTKEDGWTFGGGGYSVLEPLPSWQTTVVASQAVTVNTSTLGRDTPDLVFTADPNPPGVAQEIFYNGSAEGVGGTSLASPMWAAMQTEINQVQHSRNGWVVPALYATWYAQNCGSASPCVPTMSFAFRNITGGTNGKYVAIAGYNDSVGLGSPLGWELATTEYGTPGATAAPLMSPTPVPVITPSPSPSPSPAITPHPSGPNFAVTTIGGSGCPGGMPDATASMAPVNPGNLACFDGPTGIVYVAASGTGLDTQSTTDNYLFVNDFVSGYLRAIDITAAGNPVYTMEDRTWNNAVRAASATTASNLYGLALIAESQPLNAGLIVASSGDNVLYKVDLPTSPDPSTTPLADFKSLGKAAASFENATGTELGVVNAANGNFNVEILSQTGYLNEVFTSSLANGGNFGLTQDASAPLPNWVVVDSAKASVVKVADNIAAATITGFASGAPLDLPKEITYVSGTGAFYVANCGGNDIVRITSAGVVSVVAGDGAARELDGNNTGAEFNCPFGITNDGTNLYVTDLGGNAVRKITGVI